MSYIDWSFFEDYAPDSPVSESAFPVLAERASDVIDMLTYGRIARWGGIAALSAHCAEMIRKATAAQVEMLDLSGGVDAAHGGSGNYSGMVIGKFSYSRGGYSQGGDISYINGIPVSGLVAGYLEQCPGLLYAGADVRCR